MKKVFVFFRFYIFLLPFWMVALVLANILVFRLYKKGEFHKILFMAEPAVAKFREYTAYARWVFSGLVWLVIFFLVTLKLFF